LFFHTEDEDIDRNVSDLASASQAEVSMSGDSSSWRSLRKEKKRTIIVVSKYYLYLLNTAVQQ
jgi:predicted nucleic acid-binding protein